MNNNPRKGIKMCVWRWRQGIDRSRCYGTDSHYYYPNTAWKQRHPEKRINIYIYLYTHKKTKKLLDICGNV